MSATKNMSTPMSVPPPKRHSNKRGKQKDEYGEAARLGAPHHERPGKGGPNPSPTQAHVDPGSEELVKGALEAAVGDGLAGTAAGCPSQERRTRWSAIEQLIHCRSTRPEHKAKALSHSSHSIRLRAHGHTWCVKWWNIEVTTSRPSRTR